MNYHNLVKDFAQRTRANLETLRTLKKHQFGGEVYEVTQLINSMLGLLIFPQQRFVHRIPGIPLENLLNEGWPNLEVVGDYPQVQDLNQLIRYLRNAIAHCNITFLCDEHEQIIGLTVWNTNRLNETTWKVRLSIEDIEEITDRFTKLLLETEY